MPRPNTWLKMLFIASLILAVFAGTALAAFPDKPIVIIVGRGAGGSVDVVTRTFALTFSKVIGVPVIIKNMPAAGGQIAMKELAKIRPDGYTLNTGLLPADLVRQIRRKPGFDLRNYTWIHGMAGGDTNGVIVPYDSDIKDLKDLIERSKKETITISGTTPGGNSWLLGLFLRAGTKINYNYVTFDSGNAATMAVLGKHVTAGIASSINFPDQVKQKRIRVLALGSNVRMEELPDAPTFKELGYPKVRTESQQILMGPPKMPADVVKILADATTKTVVDPEYLKRAKSQGFSVAGIPKSPQEAHKMLNETYGEIYEILQATGELDSKKK